MITPSSLPSYSELTTALKKAGATFYPAEIHGLICGALAATGGKLDNSWLKIITLPKKNRALTELLQHVFEFSYHQLSEFSFEFSLLLPSDRADINVRTEALGGWCQGFLAGLKHYKVPLEKREPSEITDTLNDMIEIAKVNFGDLTSNDEDESAYFELVEYVRLAVLMLFQEISAPNLKHPKGESYHD